MLLVIYLGLTLFSCLFSFSAIFVPCFPSFGLVNYFYISFSSFLHFFVLHFPSFGLVIYFLHFIFLPTRSLVIQSFIICCIPSDYSMYPGIIRSYLKLMLLLFPTQYKSFKSLYIYSLSSFHEIIGHVF